MHTMVPDPAAWLAQPSLDVCFEAVRALRSRRPRACCVGLARRFLGGVLAALLLFPDLVRLSRDPVGAPVQVHQAAVLSGSLLRPAACVTGPPPAPGRGEGPCQ